MEAGGVEAAMGFRIGARLTGRARPSGATGEGPVMHFQLCSSLLWGLCWRHYIVPQSSSFAKLATIATTSGATRGGTPRPSSSLWSMIIAPISLVLTPQLVVWQYACC